ncbi:tetratricopeptide repeat protein [Litoreibacter ponti]|uniref:Tetratricopeptide repeat protein n=1 Tax=Litoreibacter ponti TaxID=1510457 RepID=A0A2T6BH97_9RHOB|nr:sulfotransferase [Litoreibacter ponti]PTX55416.1 tetratricopeptide repeat protein [Litoreibacter ponti]
MGKFDRSIQEARAKAQQGDLTAALAAVDVALAEVRQVYIFRARLLQALGRPREALRDMERIDGPDAEPAFLEMKAKLEEQLDLFQSAIDTLTRILPRAKSPAPILARRAMLYQALGQIEHSVGDLDAAIARSPSDTELYRLRTRIVPATVTDPAIAQMEKMRGSVKTGSAQAMHLHFALAKVYEDLGRHDEAFELLTSGNRIMRTLQPYDIDTRKREVAAYQSAFADVGGARGASDFAPIFVTGMPRSGTTLTEQILSAHPDVCAGGETRAFLAQMQAHLGDPMMPPKAGLNLTQKSLTELGAAYARDMIERFGPSPRHTDKSIQTLLYAGAVLAALPRAHIVVVRRNPHAVALSLYKQVFQPGKQLFSYDLEDIRAYQKSFDEMVAFWGTRLTERFHIIDYEDLVTAPEASIRDLLDRVELGFDAACLAPETNPRAVRTLSAMSVRQPINSAALDTWRRYARQLGVSADA